MDGKNMSSLIILKMYTDFFGLIKSIILLGSVLRAGFKRRL